jgi:hypothetical protein
LTGGTSADDDADPLRSPPPTPKRPFLFWSRGRREKLDVRSLRKEREREREEKRSVCRPRSPPRHAAAADDDDDDDDDDADDTDAEDDGEAARTKKRSSFSKVR